MSAGTAAPLPVQFDPRVVFSKDDVFEICGALALAEAVLRRCGRPLEAARMAEVFSVAEAGLAGPPAQEADSRPGSKSRASELTQ